MRYFEAAKIGGHDNGWIRNIRENSEILLEVTIIGWRDEVFSFFFFVLFCSVFWWRSNGKFSYFCFLSVIGTQNPV